MAHADHGRDQPREDAFAVLDRALSMCEKYGLYAILDHHGAIGSQNMDFHSGNDEQLGLYGSPEYRGKTIAMWKMIAERYRGRDFRFKDIFGCDRFPEGQ